MDIISFQQKEIMAAGKALDKQEDFKEKIQEKKEKNSKCRSEISKP